MEQCKRIQDLLLGDYIDGQADAASKEAIDGHLRRCPTCHAFSVQVKQDLLVPFETAPVQEVPVSVWSEIQNRIIQEKISHTSLLDKIQAALAHLSFPKLVPAFGSLALLVLIASSFYLNQQMQQAKDLEQGRYLASMLKSAWSATGVDDLGTSIEQYFL